ncbi:hypothetical protein AJ80_09532 [Polytolypa hystricis UAMH7299]|uniref:Uncharacterized protein n=1 Tax=Polytolypa hystricis (strain UAMH7299) TaxID=1447883 RepID=A0A2B7WPQ4_POLH7|nr:hypothetical protein AJ80_09532 [Polytolypa hystricis UAMH7299]
MFRDIDRPLWFHFDHQPPPTWRPLDPTVHSEIREHLQNKIMSDRAEYDGLSIQGFRAKFKKFLKPTPASPGSPLMVLDNACLMVKNDACLMIDEEVLHSIRDAPTPTISIPEGRDSITNVHPFIKIVSRSNSVEDGSDAWMKASINLLFDIYPQEMEFLFPYYDPQTGERDVYEGQMYGHRAPSKMPKTPKPPVDTMDLKTLREQLVDGYRQVGMEVPLEVARFWDERANSPSHNS